MWHESMNPELSLVGYMTGCSPCPIQTLQALEQYMGRQSSALRKLCTGFLSSIGAGHISFAKAGCSQNIFSSSLYNEASSLSLIHPARPNEVMDRPRPAVVKVQGYSLARDRKHATF